MLYFIELNQFWEEDLEITQALRIQMNHSMGHAVRWAEWKADLSGADSWPDITLINAARLDWKQLRWIVNQCTADTIVLTGRQDSLLALPALPHVDALDDLLQFMPKRATRTARLMPSGRACGFQYRYKDVVDTMPMPLKANPFICEIKGG